MLLNPKNKIIDGVIKAHLDQLSEEEAEKDPSLPFFNEDSDDFDSSCLYEEWLKTSSNTSIPNADGLFDSVATRLNLSRSKRNRDKFILNDILTSGTAIIKSGVCQFLALFALVIGGSGALANDMIPNFKENVFRINSGKHETSEKKIHAFSTLKKLDIRPIPMDEYIVEMQKSQNLKNPTPM